MTTALRVSGSSLRMRLHRKATVQPWSWRTAHAAFLSRVSCLSCSSSSPLEEKTTGSWVRLRPSEPVAGRAVATRPRRARPGGWGASLPEGQPARTQRLLPTHTPEELGTAAPRWPRRAVGDLIRKEFGIALAVRTVGLYLERWGF